MKKTIVVKVGTSTLTEEGNSLKRRAFAELARQIAQMMEEGHKVILVSSGATAAGRELLRTKGSESEAAAKQMLASVGQSQLMRVWAEIFSNHDITVGQILLTRSDFLSRTRYLNIRDTLEALLESGILPIINENDPVATKESFVGDNDNLAARICNMSAADLFVILTNQQGLFDKDPSKHRDARHIPEVKRIDQTILKMGKKSTSKGGTGGMSTKIEAAELASHSGTTTHICTLKEKDVLIRLAAGEALGTRFLASTTPLESRKRWLMAEATQGTLQVDRGAAEKIKKEGVSLLAVGIVSVEGKFDRGAGVKIVSAEGEILGVGLSNYNSGDIALLKGVHSSEIEERLGYSFGPEIIHRDNFAPITLHES
ncbi:MAG: glutamate 5-kinase [Chlamydiia bacterium]|nr:glutamate 5-kinase [Chlamydiia bacterium]